MKGDVGVQVSYPFGFEVNHINTLCVGLSHPILYAHFMQFNLDCVFLAYLRESHLK